MSRRCRWGTGSLDSDDLFFSFSPEDSVSRIKLDTVWYDMYVERRNRIYREKGMIISSGS